jgi:hypothetical protein
VLSPTDKVILQRRKIEMRKSSVAASMLALATIAAHAQGPPQPTRKDEVQACGVAAMTDYNKANLALMEQGTPLMSVEATIAQRRLEEEFCLRFIRCVLTDQTSLQFIAAFHSCLSDEALEKYDAVPREND